MDIIMQPAVKSEFFNSDSFFFVNSLSGREKRNINESVREKNCSDVSGKRDWVAKNDRKKEWSSYLKKLAVAIIEKKNEIVNEILRGKGRATEYRSWCVTLSLSTMLSSWSCDKKSSRTPARWQRHKRGCISAGVFSARATVYSLDDISPSIVMCKLFERQKVIARRSKC